MSESFKRDIEQTISAGPYAPTWDSLENYTIPEWYVHDRFGIFIHWGVYSVPAFKNEWYPRLMYQQGSEVYEHHVKTYGSHKVFGYKDFIPRLTAEKFDPAQWAALFKESGAQFIMPVAEHHDGFQMYGSDLSKWNAVKMGPKRDIVGELGREFEKVGLKLGVSSHRAEHWWFFDGGKHFDSDVQDPNYQDLYGPAADAPTYHQDHLANPPSEDFLEDWLLRTCELVNKYQPQIVWFDWWIMNHAFKPYLKKFAAYYYNKAAAWEKQVAINYKYDAYPSGTAVFDVERGQLSGIERLFWQTDTSVSKNSWGYIEGHDYKSATDILCDLVDIVSKNGALLLNIGPRPDGTIPEEEQAILRSIGEWLKVNGESIYGTRPYSVFGEGPTKVTDGAFTDTHRTPFTSEDIRFTTRDGVLYAIVLAASADGRVTVRSLARGGRHASLNIERVEVLGHSNAPNWEWTESGLEIQVRVKTDAPIVFKICSGK